MGTVNYKCPSCGAPLKFNPDSQSFRCEYCLSDFNGEEIRRIYAEREAKRSEGENSKRDGRQSGDNVHGEEAPEESAEAEGDAVIYTCPSCGAEVFTTPSTAATTCFYCQNPVVLGGRLSGKYKPDRVVPFFISKDKAVEIFTELVRKKKFLPKDFLSDRQLEKLAGVYFPYWYIDTQQCSEMTAIGNKIRTWRVRNKLYTETSVFRLVRKGDIVIKNVFERALKSTDRDMLQGIHPFDLTKAKKFSMSYLSGFQAEKRDIERDELQHSVDNRIDEYCKKVLLNTVKGYTGVKTEKYSDYTDIESWNYTLLPVWMLTYKYKNRIYPYAINAQTGKTYGSLPVSKGKLAILGSALFIAIIVFLLLGWFFVK